MGYRWEKRKKTNILHYFSHQGFHFCFRKLEPYSLHGCKLWLKKNMWGSPVHSSFAFSIFTNLNQLGGERKKFERKAICVGDIYTKTNSSFETFKIKAGNCGKPS